MQPQLGQGRVPVARKGAFLDHELGPPAFRSIEGNQQEVQVDRQGIHGDHLNGQGADQGGQVFGRKAVVIHPGPPSMEVTLDAEAAPVFELPLNEGAGPDRLQAERVAREVQGVAVPVGRHVEPVPEGGQWILAVALDRFGEEGVRFGPFHLDRGHGDRGSRPTKEGVRAASALISHGIHRHVPNSPHTRVRSAELFEEAKPVSRWGEFARSAPSGRSAERRCSSTAERAPTSGTPTDSATSISAARGARSSSDTPIPWCRTASCGP